MVDLNATLETLPPTQTHVIGAAIFRPSPSSPQQQQLLVLKRAALAPVFPNSWEIPGGHVDPGETVRDAVVRETHEETGLDVVHVGAEFDELAWTSVKHGKERENVQYNFVARVRGEGDGDGEGGLVRLSEREHSDYRWIGEDEVDGLETSEAMRKVLRDAFAAVKISAQTA